MFKPSILMFLLSAAPVLEAQCDGCCMWIPHHMRAGVRHIEGGGIGYSRGYSTLEAFLATDPGQWNAMPFLDLRGHIFNDGKFAGNAGLGARSILGSRVYGANVYYDYRNTHRNDYNQIGVGVETLGCLWDVRVNGYIPVGKRISRPYDIRFGGFEGHSVLVDRKFQYDMGGVDGEVGFHFDRCDFDFYGALGGYYFKGEIGKSAIGGKARVGVAYKEYVTLEFSDSWDQVFRNKFQGQLTLTIPFGPGSTVRGNCNLTRRMVQPVSRQEIIVTHAHFRKQAANNHFIFVDNLSHSNGTFESPYPTLALAEGNSNPGDFIYVFPGDGTPTGMNSGIVLQDDQQLLSSSSPHTIVTNLGVITIPKLSQVIPTIGNSIINNPVITVANNNVISGFNINSAANGVGILNTAPIENLAILNNTILTNNIAVDLNNVSGVLYIGNNNIGTNSFGHVISIVNNGIQNANYLIDGNFISTGDELIHLEYTDCAAIQTQIANNLLTNDYYCSTITVNNASLLPANIFDFQCNRIYTQDITSIAATLSNFANASILFDRNSIDINYGCALGTDCIDVVLSDNSVCNLSLTNNRIRSPQSALSVIANDDSIFNLNALNNFLGGGDTSAILVVTSNAAVTQANIFGNTLISIDGNVVDFTSNNSGSTTLDIEGNSIFGSTYSSSINCVANNSSAFSATIENNTITFSNLTIDNFDNTSFQSLVNGNQFIGAKAFINNHSTGTLCQQFNGNFSDIVQYSDGSDPFNVKNLGGGVLNLEPPVGNVGLINTVNVTPVAPGTCN